VATTRVARFRSDRATNLLFAGFPTGEMIRIVCPLNKGPFEFATAGEERAVYEGTDAARMERSCSRW
jgi:hypothetical protein